MSNIDCIREDGFMDPMILEGKESPRALFISLRYYLLSDSNVDDIE